jgi:alanine racemase
VPAQRDDLGRCSWRAVRRTIAGTVCMDQFVLDVGDDAVEAGDEVLLFGPGDAGEPDAQEWAELLGTITTRSSPGRRRRAPPAWCPA